MLTVLSGGSTEREVSLKSGQFITQTLTKMGLNYLHLDPTECDIKSALIRHNSTGIINVLHGGWGENGQAQALFEELSIPHNGCNSTAAAIFMHKPAAKEQAIKLGIQTPRSVIVTKETYFAINFFPHIIKTFDGGSTLGTQKINSSQEQQEYLQHWLDDQPRLVEEFIHGLEYSLAIFNNQVFGGLNIEFQSDICDYSTKYNSVSTLKHTEKYPAYSHLSQLYEKIEQESVALYKHLKCSGFVRMDYMINTQTEETFFLEGNNSPGMTSLSIIPDIAKLEHNMQPEDLVRLILDNLQITKPF